MLYHRGQDPHTSESIVMWADEEERIEGYGKRLWRLDERHVVDVPDWVIDYTAEYYGAGREDILPRVVLDDIRSDAGVWDDPQFVSDLWLDHEDILLDMMDRGIFGFRVGGGAVTFPSEDIPAVRLK